jgi:biotin carboxylase
MTKKKLAVIGASHFQMPLIERAQEKGLEVHAFAWQCGDVGERAADVFHPVSITEVDDIVRICREVGVDGICTIASDLATVAVSHVAEELHLTGNSVACMERSTNKNLMRRAFEAAGDPSPKSLLVSLEDDAAEKSNAVHLTEGQLDAFDPCEHGLAYPLIVKPTDRSGSRGVTKIEADHAPGAVAAALREAFEQGFRREALVEEFAEGDEFSVEGMSWEGTHHILTITRKGTTGAPHFIETAHLQPAFLPDEVDARVREVAMHALDTLGVRYGASHTELKVAPDGTIRIIEIGARMGGDCIGSHLVPLSCGIDFVGAVVDVALGREPDLTPAHEPRASASRFIFDDADMAVLERIRSEHPELVAYEQMTADGTGAHDVTDSSTRLGHFVMSAPSATQLAPYLPKQLAAYAMGDAR